MRLASWAMFIEYRGAGIGRQMIREINLTSASRHGLGSSVEGSSEEHPPSFQCPPKNQKSNIIITKGEVRSLARGKKYLRASY